MNYGQPVSSSCLRHVKVLSWAPNASEKKTFKILTYKRNRIQAKALQVKSHKKFTKKNSHLYFTLHITFAEACFFLPQSLHPVIWTTSKLHLQFSNSIQFLSIFHFGDGIKQTLKEQRGQWHWNGNIWCLLLSPALCDFLCWLVLANSHQAVKLSTKHTEKNVICN